MTTLSEQIAIETQVVVDAQASLATAQASLNATQAALGALAPHKAILDKIEEEAGTLSPEFGDVLRASVNDLRELLRL